MTTYYVRKTGSDAAAGTSAGAAWLTIDHAANTVAAGDTVYIGAGVYRELVTMDTSGSSGNVISYIGDVDGAQTGDPGLVIICAWDDDLQWGAPQRTSCLNINAKQFLTWRYVAFLGSDGTFPVLSNTADNVAFEGLTFDRCVIEGNGVDAALYLNCNAALTPTTAGLTVRNCVLHGTLSLEVDENVTAETNLKATIEHNLIFGLSSYCIYFRRNTASTYDVGGLIIRGNTLMYAGGACAIQFTGSGSVNFPTYMQDNISVGCVYMAVGSSLTAGAILSLGGNLAYQHGSTTMFSGFTAINTDRIMLTSYLLGGVLDILLYQAFGWSPFRPFQPMTLTGLANSMLGVTTQISTPAVTDVYGEAFAHQRCANYYMLDGSDEAPSDTGAKWTNEANIAVIAGYASCATSGSNSSNYVHIGGTTFPQNSDISISQVRVRVNGYIASSGVGAWEVYSDSLAETLGSGTWNNASPQAYSAWTTLAAPSGGWSAAKVGALEFKAWRSSVGGTVYLYFIQVEVTAGYPVSAGALTSRTRPVSEATIVHGGAKSLEFAGGGWHDMLIPVSATSTVISVYAYRDANYAGDNPILEVLEVPGYADQNDTQAGAASAWEELSCTIVPTAAGWCRVRLRSRDTSATGKCYFDDLTVV